MTHFRYAYYILQKTAQNRTQIAHCAVLCDLKNDRTKSHSVLFF